ncbi:MAG TPA: fumarate reductase subunit C [Candidatus Latescibacteria bacterium]|nr:fumarate reductase subunit C [Gemmatimonadota bacterium]HIM57032.1 fumarate reductase subunit C [Candidatus Latescibacterota bacterium]
MLRGLPEECGPGRSHPALQGLRDGGLLQIRPHALGGAVNPEYRPYHPKSYRPRVPIFWWLRQWAYLKFIARELTCVLVAYSAVMLLVLVVVVDQGQAAYLEFVDWLSRPSVVAFHVAVLLGALFHTVTWLNVAPMAIVLKVSGRRVPARAVLLGHYFAWVVCSAVLAWALIQK